MKFKLKALIGALALASATQAFAGANSGDLLLEVWDANTNVSYTADLGVTEAQFMSEIGFNTTTGTTSLTSPIVFNTADPLFASLFSSETTSSNIQWNVVAASAVNTSVSGFFSATQAGEPAFTNGGLTGANTRATGLVNTTADATSTGNNSYGYNTYNTDNYGGGLNWGDTLGKNYNQGAINGNPNGTTGLGYTSIDVFYAAGTNHGSGTFPTSIFEYLTQNGSDDTFTLAANGDLTLTASMSPTPIPAAVWLFGSGLLGLVGVGRRKSFKA